MRVSERRKELGDENRGLLTGIGLHEGMKSECECDTRANVTSHKDHRPKVRNCCGRFGHRSQVNAPYHSHLPSWTVHIPRNFRVHCWDTATRTLLPRSKPSEAQKVKKVSPQVPASALQLKLRSPRTLLSGTKKRDQQYLLLRRGNNNFSPRWP